MYYLVIALLFANGVPFQIAIPAASEQACLTLKDEIMMRSPVPIAAIEGNCHPASEIVREQEPQAGAEKVSI